MALRVVLVGEEAAGLRALHAVARSGHQVVSVVSASPPIAALGHRLQAEVRAPDWLGDTGAAERLRAAGVDLLLNVHSLRILPAEWIEVAGIGSFNLHPGPLPEYAGLDAPSWAIVRGESTFGVTLHWMEARVDAGPIAYQERWSVPDGVRAIELSLECVRVGLGLVARLLEQAASDPAGIPRVPQDLGRRRYYRRRVPGGGWVDWSAPARKIWNFVRACDYHPFPSPWGAPRALLEGEEIGVVGVRPTGETAGAPPGTVGEAIARSGVRVASGDEWLLVERVLVAGRRREAAAVLRPGQRLESPAA